MNISTIHLISQYLAAAGISFLGKQSDNSHFKLSWSSEDRKLLSPPINKNGYHLAFDYDSFKIGWINRNHDCFGSIEVEGKSHIEILDWIRLKAKYFGINKSYNYEFNYKTPFPFIRDDYVFPIANFELLKTLATKQLFALEAINTATKKLGHNTKLSICPQNFDFKTHLILDGNKDFKFDIGFSIPGTIINDFYFYVKAWKGDKMTNSDKSPKFTKMGEWSKNAVLINKNIMIKNAVSFIIEAIHIYSSK